MNMEDFCQYLKRIGVVEVIASWDEIKSIPTLIVRGDDKDGHFSFEFNNYDFSEFGL